MTSRFVDLSMYQNDVSLTKRQIMQTYCRETSFFTAVIIVYIFFKIHFLDPVSYFAKSPTCAFAMPFFPFENTHPIENSHALLVSFVRPGFGSTSPICNVPNQLSSHATFPHITALTIENSRHTGSLGCAPTPNQYFVLIVSSCRSLYRFCFCFSMGLICASVDVPSDCASAGGFKIGSSSGLGRGIRGVGSYVPRTSMGRESRAVLADIK
jgi:hypothetical protein